MTRGAWGTLVATALAATVLAAPLRGQTRVEVRGGVTVGSHTATAAALEMKPALSWAALVTHRLRPRLGLFGGYLRTAFGCEEGFCTGRELTVVGNHGVVGVQASAGPAWARGGLLFGTTEVGTEGEAPDAGPGFLGAVGVSLGAGRVRLEPGLTLRWMSADTPSRSDHAVGVGADVGVSVRVGGGG